MTEITIEKFRGEPKNWSSFFDILQALLLNINILDNVQKFIYLKSSLNGEPLKLVKNLSLKSNNFIIATSYSHIMALVEMSSINKNNPNNLRDFIVNTKQNKESLKIYKYR